MINSKRLTTIFTDLVKIDSPSKEEQEVAKYIKKFLDVKGIKNTQDKQGSIYAHIQGNSSKKLIPIIFNAHMDTVEPGRGIKPVLKNGVFKSAGKTILGADDKAGIAEILEFVASIKDGFKNEQPVELLFTVDEEDGGTGAKNIDVKKLKGKEVLVIDAGGRGKITMAAPFLIEYDVELIGASAHAGLEPEKGKNAMLAAAHMLTKIPVGRIDNQSVANIGFLNAGQAINAVPATATFRGEIRSQDKKKANKILAKTIQIISQESKKLGIKHKVVDRLWCGGYSYTSNHALVKKVVTSFKRVGIIPKPAISHGASDANHLALKGFVPLDIGAGYKGAHTVNESVKLADMVVMVEFLQDFVNQN